MIILFGVPNEAKFELWRPRGTDCIVLSVRLNLVHEVQSLDSTLRTIYSEYWGEFARTQVRLLHVG